MSASLAISICFKIYLLQIVVALVPRLLKRELLIERIVIVLVTVFCLIEDREHSVVILMRNGIELVRMTLSTA